MLPSGYVYMTGLQATLNNYIDTGVNASSDLEVEMYFGMDLISGASNDGGYVMGARDSNSNSSVNQFNLYIGKTNTNDYVGFVNQRIAQNMNYGGLKLTRWHFSNIQNTFSLVASRKMVSQFTGRTDSFSGSQSIYLFALNNAGTPTYKNITTVLYGCKFTKSGTVIRNFVPVYNETTSQCGLYDLANNQYYPSSNLSYPFDHAGYEISTSSNGHGKGYVVADQLGYVEKARFLNTGAYDDSCTKTPVTVTAMPDEGYEFQSWSINGTVVSYEKTYTFLPDASDLQVQANFMKVAMDMPIGCKAITLAYGIGTGSTLDAKSSMSYMNVISASVKNDLMQRSTSTITVESVPSTVGVDCPIFLYTAKNKLIYYGIIKSIDGNVLTCREPISIYDDDYLFKSSSYYNAHYTVAYGIYNLLEATPDNYFVERKTDDIYPYVGDPYMQVDTKAIVSDVMPLISSEVINLENKLFELYNSYGVFMEPSMYQYERNGRHYVFLKLVPVNGNSYPVLVIGDNVENLTDVEITTETADSTIIDIYNSGGSSLRATYLMCNDNVIRMLPTSGAITLTQYVAYQNCKRKIVLSDDNAKTIARENLNDSLYTHSIRFTLNIGGLVRFDDIKIGQPVKFYYENKAYESCVTAYEFELGQYESEVRSVKFTLGRIRKTLTSKLNLKKI